MAQRDQDGWHHARLNSVQASKTKPLGQKAQGLCSWGFIQRLFGMVKSDKNHLYRFPIKR